jgi:hypothetical protein
MAVVASLVVLATTAGGATAEGASGLHRTATGTCTTSQLTIRLTRSLVAAGNVGGVISLKNRSGATCRLTGWPTLVAVTRAGRSTTARHVRTTMFGPPSSLRGVPVVTLPPGKIAKVVFAGGDNPGPGRTSCPPAYHRLRISPPGSSRSAVLSAWLPSLNAFLPACARISVTMVVPSSALRR